MDTPQIPYEAIRAFFDDKLREFGATPLGVSWNSPKAQILRFRQLLRICESETDFSILDYGCGYGAMLDFMYQAGYRCTYIGYDLLESMVEKARELHPDCEGCLFTSDVAALPIADYTVASGIFNVKFEAAYADWTNYVLKTLHELDRLSRKGFAFNMLTRYSDAGKMRDDLYYADPTFIFNYCKSMFARNVALLHDYEIYDFTILVRKVVNLPAY